MDLNVNNGRETVYSRNWRGPWKKTPGRLFGTTFIRFYQLTLSGFIGNSCRHYPTCSEYAYEAIARHGLWAGGFMGLFRVVRCGPGGTHGVDLVPESLSQRYRWYRPWRYWDISRQKMVNCANSLAICHRNVDAGNRSANTDITIAGAKGEGNDGSQV